MDNLVKVTINGREYMLPKGMNLVDAAKSVGVEIPVFCYHPKLKPVGACRMCLVEMEKVPKLQTACTTTVADGMVINSKSPRATAGQNATIEFLLANHPLDCPVCDKGGECPLQDNTFGYGKGVSVFAEMKRHFVKPIPLSDKILLDRERCIMCYRCVRFTREIAGDETLTVLERGSWSQIGTLDGKPFDSPFSGNTIEICPVGALTSAKYRFKARPWDIANKPTVCSLCSVGCNVTLTIRDNKVARVLARENAPVDDGWLCDRGRFSYDFVNDPDRLTQPLIRRNGTLQPASWPEAIGFIRDRLQETMVKRGPSAVAAIGSPRGTNEEAYLLQKLMRVVVGTNNVDHNLARHTVTPGLPYDAASGSIAGLERANVIVLADINPLVEQPVLDLRLKKAAGRGARLVVIGPDRIDLVGYGALWLRTAADQVGRVLAGLLAVVVGEGLTKGEFVDGRVQGADGVVAAARATDLDRLAADTGVSRDLIAQAARLYAGAGNGSVLYRRVGAAAGTPEAATSLALLCGQIGRPGAGVYPLARDANEQGAIDVGATPDRLPGHRPLGDVSARRALGEFWGRPVPDTPGIAGADLFGAIGDGLVSAVYLIGQDPVGDGVLGEASRTTLGKLDLLVVQDTFLTETAKLATVVLPGVTFAEKDGTYTNLERRVQRLNRAVNPGDGARADWEIIRDLGLALGGDFDYQSSGDVLAEITLTVPMYRGLSAGRLGSKGIQWPRQLAGAGTESLYAAADPAEPLQASAVLIGGARVGSSS